MNLAKFSKITCKGTQRKEVSRMFSEAQWKLMKWQNNIGCFRYGCCLNTSAHSHSWFRDKWFFEGIKQSRTKTEDQFDLLKTQQEKDMFIAYEKGRPDRIIMLSRDEGFQLISSS